MKVHCHYNITSKKHLRESKKGKKDEKKITKQKKIRRKKLHPTQQHYEVTVKAR